MGVERPVQGDVRNLPFAAASFDLVLSIDVLAHLPRPDERTAAREMARVLAPGGLLAVRTSALDFLRSRHSAFAFERQRFTRRRLIDALHRGRHSRAALHAMPIPCCCPWLPPKFRLWEPLLRRPPASGVEPVPRLARPPALPRAGRRSRLARRAAATCPPANRSS